MRETVFVVERDPDVRAALGELLEVEGKRPILFRGAQEAAASFTSERPSLCVVDALGGAEALIAIREPGAAGPIPVVVFTGWASVAGPGSRIAIVDKPDIAGLLATIDRALAARADSFD
ncbi:MAG TPA: hypothetical protein VHO06_26310 [Polyangia bacterium]|nr:hypothetical protein [Polyangia bacterium]